MIKKPIGRMNPLEHYTTVEDRAEFRPVGAISLEHAVASVTSVIDVTRERGLRKLLVVATGLKTIKPPSLGARYFAVQQWARASGGRVKVAMVIPAELFDPQQFGVTVAKNMGFDCVPFTTEAEASQWLNATTSTPPEEK